MSKYLIITISLLIGSFRSLAQLGDPFIQSFPPSAYQNDAYMSSPQNWGIIQDNRGIIYVSNTTGILEYDGISWQLVNGTAYEGRFKFSKNSEGKIFVGSTRDLGYLAPDTAGKIQFVSLLSHLKGKYSETWIKKVITVGRDAYFYSDNDLFRWSGKHFKIWSSKAGFESIFSYQNQVYAIDKEKGLCELKEERLIPMPGGENFREMTVKALLPFPADSTDASPGFLVITYDQGLYTYKNQELKEFVTKPAKTLDQVNLLHGITLADGTIALATKTEGVVIINREGLVKKVIAKQTGLTDNTVLNLYIDKEKGLWAATNKGINRIAYPSPVSYLNETSGLDGIVLDILKKEEYLFAGTTSGLYVIDEKATEPTFKKMPQLQNEVWKIKDVGDELLIVSTPGVYALSGNVLKRISPPTEGIVYQTVQKSADNPNKMYVGSSDGLAVITRRKGRWKWEGKVKNVDHEVSWLAIDKKGTLWASCNDSISAIDDSEEYGLQPPVRNFHPPADLVKELRSFPVHSINGKIYFGTSKGIYSLQKHGERISLKPDDTFGERFADGSREAINLTEDNKGHIWLTSEFRTGQLRKLQNKAYVWDTIPLSKMPHVDVWTIYTDAEGVVWLGTTEGIYRYNPHVPKNYKVRPQTVLREVTLAGDSTVFFGAFAGQGTATVEQSPRFKLTLPHAIRSISFEYAATSYDAPGQLLYSYMLEGEDKNWSHWTTETKKEYTGLDEGEYVFKVKSKNIYGTQSLASTFEFSSLPPFYRTWWAYSFYLLLWGFIIWGIIKVQHRNLIASKISLERLVHERTAQLEAEKKKSDDLLLNILPAETAEELKTNGRALARSYDTVTVLFTDFKDFTKISEDLTPEELVAVIDFYFCAFDRIIAKYNIEKIKTIGDAYMCAGGIPNPEANTPADVVKAGMEILAFVESLNPDNQLKKHKFEIRIGVHTGPVVAGIVGTQKFAYDIWGDTVNTAARMESSCQEGKVNISGATYALVKDEFICTYRGRIDAKNKGEIDMYFVEAVAPKHVLV